MAETKKEQPETAVEQPQVGLTLQDLLLVSQIIQLCNSRGAFRVEELQAVGTLYNKLIAFLEQTGAINKGDLPNGPSKESSNA